MLTFAVALATMMINTLVLSIQWEWLANLVLSFSLFSRYNDFAVGVFNFSDVLYYLSVATVFTFLTVRVLEGRRWR